MPVLYDKINMYQTLFVLLCIQIPQMYALPTSSIHGLDAKYKLNKNTNIIICSLFSAVLGSFCNYI